ncbi:MAG: hypothetical protein IKY07_07985 [Clostridia bacterium]|nr:hypothetical protein [Clostridia bacterium]
MMAKKKKGSLFWKIFAVAIVLLGIAAIIALRYGEKVMMDYDASQSLPLKESQELADSLSAGNFDKLFDVENIPNTMIFERESFIEKTKALIEEAGGCTVKKGFSFDRVEKPTYVIAAGNTKIATVEFQKTKEKSEYGFATYKMVSVTPNTNGHYGISVLVPETCTFYLNGIEVPDAYKTGETEQVAAQKDSIEPEKDDPRGTGNCEFSYYYVDALENEPSVKLVYKTDSTDAELIYSDTYKAWTVTSHDITVTAPMNYKVFVNGREISADGKFLSKDHIDVAELSAVLKYIDGDIYMKEYHVSGIRNLASLSVSATDFEGNTASPEHEENSREYTFKCGLTPAEKTKYGIDSDFLFERAINYARFVNNDGSYWDIMYKYVLKPSQASQDFESYWVVFSPHDSYWIEDKNVDEITFFSEEIFRATVSFEYWIKGYNHEHDNVKEYDNRITFWYVRDEKGTWKIVDWGLG